MALTVRGDGTGTAFLVSSSWWNDYYDLLTGAMTDQPVTISNKVTLKTTNAQLAWNGTLSGSNRVILDANPTDASTKEWQLLYKTNSHLTIYNHDDSLTLMDIPPSGPVDFPQGVTKASGVIPTVVNSWGASKITVGPTTPGSAVKGDVWIKTPFS